jgi:hypothetical protein
MKTRTKRNSNKKTLATAGLVALAAVSVFSVGFASWIIGSETTGSTGTFDVTVESVTDSRVQIKSAAMVNDDIVFGALTDNAGLITSTATTEDLIFSLEIRVATTEMGNFQGFNFYYSSVGDDAEKTSVAEYLATQSTPEKILWPGKYGTVEAPAYLPLVDKIWKTNGETYYALYDGNNTVTEVVKTGENEPEHSWKVAVSIDGVDTVFTITANIKWGAYFGNKNPVEEKYPTTTPFKNDDVQHNATLFKNAITGLSVLSETQNIIHVQHPTEAVGI